MSSLDDYIRKLPGPIQDTIWDISGIVHDASGQVQENWAIAKNVVFTSTTTNSDGSPSLLSTATSTTTSFFGLGGSSAPITPSTPPPPPPTTLDSLDRFVRAHPYAVGGTALAVTGFGVAWVGLGPTRRAEMWRGVSEGGKEMSGKVVQLRREREDERKAAQRPLNRDGHRLEVVVILGADASPLGYPLALFLESQGFIVVASVSTSAASAALERAAHGFVRAIVLDASGPSAVDPFLASLQGVLTLKFPLGSPGDPYQSSSAQTPTITSVVSLLALAPAQGAIALQAPLVTPLAIVTHLLPKLFEPLPSSVIPTHLRGGSNDKSAVVRRKTFATETVLKKVVVFLPAVGTLQGPGLTSPKVTNDAVRTAFKTLAAEISTAAANTFDGEQPCGVRVEVVDLGFVNAKRRAEVEWKAGVAKAMQVLGQRWAGWLKSWVGGRRVWSGFEVLERAMMRTLTAGGSAAGGANRVLGLGVLGGWARRGVGHVGATGTYGQIRVGAGSWTYTFLPSLIPASMLNLLLRRASSPPATLPLNPTSNRPAQTAAARAAGLAASQRQQTTAAPAAKPATTASSDSETDSVPSSMEASTTSNLGDSWVHERPAGVGESSLGESWTDGTWGRS